MRPEPSLSLQPGVVPGAYGGQAPDINDRSPSGGLHSGNQSVNGQREAANGFMVNGANVEEGKNNGASFIPNFDSISEFRIITNNFDSEYATFRAISTAELLPTSQAPTRHASCRWPQSSCFSPNTRAHAAMLLRQFLSPGKLR